MGKLFRNFKQYLANTVLNDLTNANNKFYVFASKSTPWPDETVPPAVFETNKNMKIEASREMLFGKKVSNTNFKFLVNRYDWQTGNVYSQYDHTDINLMTKPFFVVTDENKVYKCLYNNKGANSVTKPTLTTNTVFTTPTDGYVWKYMYSIPVQTMSQFGSTNYMPIVTNTAITNSAIAGIDVVEVVGGGQNYRTFVNGTVQGQPNSTIIQIDSFASSDNDFYYDSAIYISTGPGAGQLSRISDYVTNSTGNFVSLDTPITGLTPAFTTYSIAPRVNITGDGTGAKAYATVNATNYAISSIVVISPGSGYSYANAAIVSNTSYGTGANLIAYAPPYGGHGKNVMEELGSQHIGFYMEFANTESGTITTDAKYRTVGLLINPLQSNTSNVYTANTFSSLMKFTVTPSTAFTLNETVVGNTSGAIGYVVFSNTTITHISGDKTFANGELIVGRTSGANATINAIATYGNVTPLSADILYMNNIIPVQRSNTQTEAVKFVIQL